MTPRRPDLEHIALVGIAVSSLGLVASAVVYALVCLFR